jgi:DNA-binding response OmpR family regulator
MKQHILAVDDEPQIRQLVKMSLETAGFDVATASNGQEAIEAIHARTPDLVVMDVTMPVKTGIEALQELKANESTSSIPVIMLTANAEDTDVFEGWQSGAHAYLNKPFNPRELLVFVQNILAEEGNSSNKTYEITETSE